MDNVWGPLGKPRIYPWSRAVSLKVGTSWGCMLVHRCLIYTRTAGSCLPTLSLSTLVSLLSIHFPHLPSTPIFITIFFFCSKGTKLGALCISGKGCTPELCSHPLLSPVLAFQVELIPLREQTWPVTAARGLTYQAQLQSAWFGDTHGAHAKPPDPSELMPVIHVVREGCPLSLGLGKVTLSCWGCRQLLTTRV